MQKTVTFARIRPDGTLVRVTSDGSEVSIMPEQVKKTVRWISDPQAPRDEDAQSTRSEPHVTTLRRALALTQKEFAARFHLPLATLRDWERGLSEPDQPMCAYLTVIALHPEVVSRALRKRARADRLRALATLADSQLSSVECLPPTSCPLAAHPSARGNPRDACTGASTRSQC